MIDLRDWLSKLSQKLASDYQESTNPQKTKKSEQKNNFNNIAGKLPENSRRWHTGMETEEEIGMDRSFSQVSKSTLILRAISVIFKNYT